MKNVPRARKLEKELIDAFKEEFYQKLGYHPVVLVRHEVSTLRVGYMTLEELVQQFEPFLPMHYGSPLPLTSRRRFREIVELRAIYFFIAKQMNYSLNAIGLGHFHHTTIIHGLKLFSSIIETDPAFKEKYYKIINHIISQQKSTTDYESSVMESLSSTQCDAQPDVFTRLLQVEDSSWEADQRPG